MSWDEIKAEFDILASLRGYKPVDQVLTENQRLPRIPRPAGAQVVENPPHSRAKRLTRRRAGSPRGMYWQEKDEQ